jgi:lysophospholipase L1-like esterase
MAFTIAAVTAASLAFGAVPADAHNSSITVAFGDSNTAGSVWKTNGYDYEKKWTAKLGNDRPVVNAGVPGNTTGHAINRLPDILAMNAKTVTIMFGTNDGVLDENFIPKTSWRQFEKNLNYLADYFQAGGTNIVFMTAVPIIECEFYKRHDKNLYLKYGGARAFFDKYNDITRKVAAEQGAGLVDTHATFIRFAGGNTDTHLIESGLMDGTGTHMSMYGADVLYRTLTIELDKRNY